MLAQVCKRALNLIVKSLNYDFCPWANSSFYWLKQPVGWVVCAVLASILVGLFVGPQGFVLTGAFVALLILGVLWPWLCMKGLSCELNFSQLRSIEGEPTKAILTVVNRLPVPVFGLMVQGKFLQDLIHEDDVIAVGLKQVPGWSVSSFDWPVVPNRRGELPTEKPSIVTGFPFGLYQMSKPIQVTGSTIVWPKTNKIETPVETLGTQFAIDATASRQAGNDGETIGVRDYRYGDSVRNIHWSHTARHDRLILRERQSLTQTPMRVVLDLTLAHHAGSGSHDTYENAIRLAASVCCELHRNQFQIDLVCLGLAASLPTKSSNHRGLKELMDFLARLPESDNEPLFAPVDMVEIETSLRCPGTYAFLIHTDKIVPDVDTTLVKCICVDSNFKVGSESSPLGEANLPSFPASTGPTNSDLGAICVPT